MGRRFLGAAALLLLAAAACGDPNAGNEPAVAGVTVESPAGGQYASTGLISGRVQGSVAVKVGEEKELVMVLFYGDGSPVRISGDRSVRVTVANPALAAWTVTGPTTGTLRGTATGSTSLTVELVRSGKAVWTSPPIPVTVQPEL
ncbi:MAG TPA: hypothetical protein VFQ45_20735 [Longimicrobium sp.]|nr:hypothetical protein [Longimicrobium sp.]